MDVRLSCNQKSLGKLLTRALIILLTYIRLVTVATFVNAWCMYLPHQKRSEEVSYSDYSFFLFRFYIMLIFLFLPEQILLL